MTDRPRSDGRNRYVDLLRVLSIGVVVLGHWLTAVVEWEGGTVRGQGLLAMAPGLQLLTWVFQVMTVFFIVGGYANGASWDSAHRRGIGYGGWLRARAVRLFRPTAAFVLVWVVALAAARAVGVDDSLLRVAGKVSQPLWFLAVYAFVIPAAPPMLEAHRRYGWRVPVGLAAAAAAVDLASWGLQIPLVGWINFALVWLTVHHLGYLWRDGFLTRRAWIPGAMIAGGLVVLSALVVLGPYPVSMVGVDGGGRTNNTPPSLPLVALAVWQLGLILTLQGRANRALSGAGLWKGVILANSMVMTVYLWHVTAMALTIVTVYPSGIWPEVAVLSPQWWALRPIWVLVSAAYLVPLAGIFWRIERTTPVMGAQAGGAAVLAGTLLASVGLSLLALQGFYAPDLPGGIPAWGLLPFLAGVALVQWSTRAVSPIPEPDRV